MECTLIVFGDVGRSPRMQNHALEIVAQTDLKVNLVGYLGKSIPLMSSIENPPYQEI